MALCAGAQRYRGDRGDRSRRPGQHREQERVQVGQYSPHGEQVPPSVTVCVERWTS